MADTDLGFGSHMSPSERVESVFIAPPHTHIPPSLFVALALQSSLPSVSAPLGMLNKSDFLQRARRRSDAEPEAT